MNIEHWLTVKAIFLTMCYIGVATNTINLLRKIFFEKKPLKRWIGGTLITSILGFVLFGISFGIFGIIETNPIKRELFYLFVLIIGILMPLWLDPILTIKYYLDKKRYADSQNMQPVFAFLIILSVAFIALLIFDKISA
jgi:hypothetical protein